MSKRRRTSSIASRQEEDSLDSIETSHSGPTMRKRPKKQDPMELCQQLYESIRTYKKEDGNLLCDAFIRVPKRRQEPSYYEVVSNPIDLLKVQQKLKTDEYEDVDELQTDIELIVNNARAFYKRNTQEYKDACELLDLFLTNRSRIVDGKEDEERVSRGRGRPSRKAAELRREKDLDQSEDTSEGSHPDDESNPFEDLFTAVMTATDMDNRSIHSAFQFLPSKKKYPEYYEVIESPIDLKTIASKIQGGEYATIIELEKDLLLLTKNACLFNEPGSQIYKDAKTLKKIIVSKKMEIDHTRYSAGKSSERIRNKKLRSSTSLSAITAAMKEEESESEVEEELMDETSETVDSETPQWQLFDTIRKVGNPSGGYLSEPFWRLPSRRFYPDYYKEIKNPVSLTQIKRKLMFKSYGTLSEVAGDMNIMLENAKKYNLPSSKLYKDAVKLQKVMQNKVQELLDIDQVTHRVTNKTRKDTDSEDYDDKIVRKKSGQKSKYPLGTPSSASKRKDPIPLKRRLHAISKFLLDYTCEDGRKPMLAFMEKPSKKLYSEYYEVIREPIDFLDIESKIRGEQYASESDLVRDFKLMFSNCRQFNEENSIIYEDANLLEKILLDKVDTYIMPEKRSTPRVVKPRKVLSPAEKNLRSLYDTIRDYREPKANRQLSVIFMKLPSKSDYPDYYEVIKNPIDMEKIAHKLKLNSYEALDDLVNDFVLMFDNACKYNEPDSQIYKDALILQRVCLQTKLQLKEDDDTVPDVPAAIQDLLLNLFTSVYNHQDADERCYSDSMAELPEHDEIDGKKIRALSLDLIKRRLDKGLYRRLDTFQEDFFACLERARRLTRSDSPTFDDAIELQLYFIKIRDELCKSGEILQSPALNYTQAHLMASLESVRESKMLQESIEDENETRSSEDSVLRDVSASAGESMTVNQQTFKVGEFVYMDAKEKGVEPHILLTERLWTNTEGQKMLYGNFYLRPAETYHLSTRKFLEKEVFKSDTHVAVPLEEVRDRCCVMNIKQYFTMKPEGYEEKDIYVCESRYSTKNKIFKKMKVFPEVTYTLTTREEPLEPKRVVSIFRERVEKHKDELAELQEQEKLMEKEKPNVVAFSSMGIDDGNTYYEQYNTICSGVVKTGDFVYVAADGGRQTIAQIDTIWETKDGKCYFRGPWFVTPPEIPHSPSRMFFRQEIFLSSVEDTNPIVSVIGKCCVLDYNDYISCRPTEIAESDVMICNSMYDEVNRQIRKLPQEGLKKFTHGSAVTEDEIYYFPRLINPPKVGSELAQLHPENLKPQNSSIVEVATSPIMTKMTDMEILMEDSLDGGPPSVGSGEIPTTIISSSGNAQSTPSSSKKKSNKNKVVTGYILYSREVRKRVVQTNPDSNFGEISKLVGNEWRSLPASEKQAWEERASRLNEETKALLLSEECGSPAPGTVPVDQVYECLWDGCDFQFEEVSDCIEHSVKDKDGQGHVQSYFQNNPDAEMHCQWRNCGRNNKKNLQPFPNISRLIRHVRDMHINKGNGRVVAPSERSKNFRPSSKPTAVARPTPSATPNSPASSAFNSTANSHTPNTSAVQSTPAVVAKQEPMFITVPPRPQRVLYSEAYIKYIEGLQADNKYISNWERTLNATKENTPTPDPEKINAASTWLGKKYDQQEDVINALWSLRNQLLRDSLGLQKTF